MKLTTENQLAVRELINRYKHGLEATIRMTTKLWDIRVVFEGTRAYTKGRTIFLPNVDILAMNTEITNEAVEDARAYFTALVGYAWREVSTIVESDARLSARFAAEHGQLANVIRSILDEIRTEYRFSARGVGIAEAIEYLRETWVWPRVARQIAANQDGGVPDLVHEALHGLQCVMKHQDYDNHPLWRALSLEAQTFVERNLEELEAAHDTLKMDATDSAARLGEIVVRMLARWRAEWETAAPWIRSKGKRPNNDWGATPAPEITDTLDTVKGEDDLKTADGVSPFLLVTYSSHVATLLTIPFADGYIARVDELPTTSEEWEALQPLADDETRTLVALPPDPAIERALNEAMAELVRQTMALSREVSEQVEQELANVEKQLEDLPEDEKPYLVYTTANDQYPTTPEASLQTYGELHERAMQHVGVMKRRLQVLLRTRTKTKWRRNQPEGDDLDQDAMADIAISKHVPQLTPTPFRIKADEDVLCETVVGMLVDVSGSMGRGEQSKLELAREAGLCFAEAFALAEIRFGVYAFTSGDGYEAEEERSKLIAQCQEQGMTNEATEDRINLYARFGGLYIETIKSFAESWEATKRRLPAMGSRQLANYDADSVHWTARQLLSQKAKRRVLFVLSDGRPDTSEGMIQVARQRRHLSDVVRELIARSVEIVGVGICDASVKLYYPRASVIQRPIDLPACVMNEMNHLLIRSR